MKRFVSVWRMPKHTKAFTLIEVLVAVMIISVVISALLQLFATNAHTFSSVEAKIHHTNRTSLILGNKLYGYEKKKVDLAELVKDFNIDDDLRRKLKNEKIEIIYTEVTSIDFDDAAESISENEQLQEGEDEEAVTDASAATTSMEIGKTTVKLNGESSAFLRVKLQ